MKHFLIRYFPLVLLAIAWEVVARLELVSSSALPPLSDVITAGIDMIKDGELISNGAASLYRAGVGLALAIFVGGILGIAMAWWKPVNVLLAPLVEIFYPLPKSALIPVTVIWLGFGDGSKILLIFLGCMLPVTIGAFNGARSSEQGLVRAQHGCEPVSHALGCRVAERHAGTAQRHPDRIGTVFYLARFIGVDRCSKRFRLPDRISGRQRHLRCDVCGCAYGSLSRVRRRSPLSQYNQADACMARLGQEIGRASCRERR